MTKDDLRKIALNSVIPNLHIYHDKREIGLYSLLNKNSPITDAYGHPSLIIELGIRHFIDGNDIFQKIAALLPNKEKDPELERATEGYDVYSVDNLDYSIVKKLACGLVLPSCLSNVFNWNWFIQTYPNNFEKMINLLSECKEADIIGKNIGEYITVGKSVGTYSTSDICSYLWTVSNKNKGGYLGPGSFRLSVNLTILSQSVRNNLRAINRYIISLVEHLEKLKIHYINVHFAFYIFDNKVYCFTMSQIYRWACVIPDRKISVKIKKKYRNHKVIFLEPVELVPKNKREKKNLSLLLSTLITNEYED
jgi:hypothetical protein